MDARTNFLEAVRFGNPGYVPCTLSMPVKRVGFYGVNPDDNRPDGAETWTDLWQVRHRHQMDGVMPFPVYHPMEHLDDWSEYIWPDPADPALYEDMKNTIAALPDRDAVLVSGSHRSTLLERAWKLVGMDNLFMMMITDPDRVAWLLERIMDFQLGVAEQYVRIGIDMASPGDDHGTQASLLFSPELFRKLYKPQYARLFSFYRSRDIVINFHSDGNVLPLVDDFIELGIDILNPVQATALDLPELRQRTAGRMALLGGVSTGTIEKGTPEDVREEVRNRIRTLGREGGYICGPDHSLPFPPANVAALRSAVEEYGGYPIE
jgi:uroporphyrinogen decarboxylase